MGPPALLGDARLRVESFRQALAAARAPGTVDLRVAAAERFEAFLERRGWTLSSAPVHALAEFVASGLRGRMAGTIRYYAVGARQYVAHLAARGMRVPTFAPPVLPRIKERATTELRGSALREYGNRVAELSEPYRTALLLLPGVGLRVAELTTLRRESLQVRRERGQALAWVMVRGKSKKERPVPLHPQLLALLSDYLRRVRPHLAGGSYLFPNSKGGPISVRTLQKRLQDIGRAMGVRLHPHALRHHFITGLLEKGAHLLEVGAIVGHENPATTKRYYHPSAESLSRTVITHASPDWLR
jgi:site-specific recombinase XerD